MGKIPSKLSKTLSTFLTFFFLFQLIAGIFLFVPRQAKAEFSEDFSDTNNIGSRAGVSVDTTVRQASLPYFKTTLDDADTTLLSHLGQASDITSPVIGTGGTATTTISYVAGSDGNGAQLPAGGSSMLYFPSTGNLNPTKGTISFWASSSDWTTVYLFDYNKTFYNLGAYYTSGQLNFYNFYIGAQHSVKNSVSLATGVWHHFVFTWDCQIGVLATIVDDIYQSSGQNSSDGYFFTGGSCSYNSPPRKNLYFGEWGTNKNSASVVFDEIRITQEPYLPFSNYIYSSRSSVLTSATFDTGVSNPVWGNIEWTSTTPAGTSLLMQTNVSSDNSTWDGWLRKGMVSFTYDDGNMSQYTNAYPILSPYDFPATVFIITNSIGGSNMTLDQLHTLENAGWEIGGHGYQHLDISTLTESQLRSEVGDNCATYLRNQGFNIKSYATPFGKAPGINTKWILDDYYSYVRGSDVNMPYYVSISRGETMQYPLYSPIYLYWTYAQYASALANATATVASAVSNKDWVVFTDHLVDNNDVLLSGLAAYTATQDVDVVTVAGGMEKLSYQTSAGSQITSANKRYIEYRAIIYSSASTTSPTLSSITIREPAHFYKELTNTINASGIYTHSVWPQTTDTEVSNLTITPSTSSVDVAIDTWNTTSTYYKKWTESSATHDVTASHTIGDLRAGQYYQVKVNDVLLQTIQADGAGEISFIYSGGYSDETFEVEEIPTAPTITTPTPLSSTSIQWNFTDNSDNETGFRVYTNADAIATSSAIADLSSLTETGLAENTQYTRYVKVYNSYGESVSSSATSTYTLADTPTGLTTSNTANQSITVSVDTFPNVTSGSSGYYFSQGSHNSGWIQTNSWQDTGLGCSGSYSYSVKYRNRDGVETSAITQTFKTPNCAGAVLIIPQISQQATLQPTNTIQSQQPTQSASNPMLSVPNIFSFQAGAKQGTIDQSVKYLQIILNQDPDTQLAKAGVGSPGKETNFFGSKTKQAVIKFQEKYKDEILKPWGLTKGTGIIGKTTKAKLNQLIGK